MEFKVVINYGWSADVFFYRTLEQATNIVNSVTEWQGAEAHIYMRSGLAWILCK